MVVLCEVLCPVIHAGVMRVLRGCYAGVLWCHGGVVDMLWGCCAGCCVGCCVVFCGYVGSLFEKERPNQACPRLASDSSSREPNAL